MFGDQKLKTPEFKNEAEEARWYSSNQDALLAEFKDAVKEGTLGRGTLAKRGLTPTTTIRLDKRDIEFGETAGGAAGTAVSDVFEDAYSPGAERRGSAGQSIERDARSAEKAVLFQRSEAGRRPTDAEPVIRILQSRGNEILTGFA